jgi:ankyrin repeat protein
VASNHGHVQVVKELLEHGADIEVKDSNGWTSLHSAAVEGHSAVVNELLEHGVDIEATTNSGSIPLHQACFFGSVAVVIELLGHGADIDANNDSSNGAPTSILGKRKSRGGANIEAKDDNGDTPLHIASWKGHLAIVKALLAVGADILAANIKGQLAIHRAVGTGKSAVVKCLLQHFYATTRRLPLHELLKDLTSIGNPWRSDVRAALHRKVLRTDDIVEIVEYLAGQYPELLSSRDQVGSLPLHMACRRGASFAIVQSLVNLYKASVKSVTSEGDLPLFLACEITEPSLDTIFFLTKLYPDVVYR